MPSIWRHNFFFIRVRPDEEFAVALRYIQTDDIETRIFSHGQISCCVPSGWWFCRNSKRSSLEQLFYWQFLCGRICVLRISALFLSGILLKLFLKLVKIFLQQMITCVSNWTINSKKDIPYPVVYPNQLKDISLTTWALLKRNLDYWESIKPKNSITHHEGLFFQLIWNLKQANKNIQRISNQRESKYGNTMLRK